MVHGRRYKCRQILNHLYSETLPVGELSKDLVEVEKRFSYKRKSEYMQQTNRQMGQIRKHVKLEYLLVPENLYNCPCIVILYQQLIHSNKSFSLRLTYVSKYCLDAL